MTYSSTPSVQYSEMAGMSVSAEPLREPASMSTSVSPILMSVQSPVYLLPSSRKLMLSSPVSMVPVAGGVSGFWNSALKSSQLLPLTTNQ